MKNNLKKFKSSALFFISSIAFVFLGWLLLFGKIKAAESIASLFNKLPQNQSELINRTEKVLGEAIQKVRGGDVQKVVNKSSEIFESSEVAEPARDLREGIKQKVDETFATVKELPAKELKVIQRQICKEWLGDELLMTPGGE